MYCTPDDVRHALAADNADGVDIEQTAASMDDAQLTDHISDAQSEVDSKLAVRYVVPFADGDVPPVVKTITLAIAAYLATLTFRRTADLGDQDPVMLRYTRAESMLSDIRDGKAQLPVSPPAEEPATSATLTGINRYSGRLFTARDFDLGPAPRRRGCW